MIISDFVYTIDKHGNQRGWGVAEYNTPEKFMGKCFMDRVYQRTPEESYQRLLEHLRMLFPHVGENELQRVLG